MIAEQLLVRLVPTSCCRCSFHNTLTFFTVQYALLRTEYCNLVLLSYHNVIVVEGKLTKRAYKFNARLVGKLTVKLS